MIKKYAKPVLNRIELKPEEAVLSACKSGGWPVGGGGPKGACDAYTDPWGNTVQFNCMTAGS